MADLVLGKLLMEGVKDQAPELEDSKKMVTISEKALMNNLCFIGTKNTGKGQTVIPLIFKQHLEEKAGISVFTSRTETAYNLYYMAKKAKKSVKLLKPSCDLDIINFIYNQNPSSEDINKLVDIPKLIDNCEIMIVDMEFERFSSYGMLAAERLLVELQRYMDSNRHNRKHYVYLDDAEVYLASIKNLLTYGDEYNFATILFLQTREQLHEGEIDYRPMIDSLVRNTILLQGLTFTDAEYFARVLDLPERDRPDRFFLQAQIKDLLSRKYGEFSYEILSEGDFTRKTGIGKLLTLQDNEVKTIEAGAKRYRAKLEVNWQEEDDMRMVYEKKALENLSKKLFNDNKQKSVHDDFLKSAENNKEQETAQQNKQNNNDKNEKQNYFDKKKDKNLKENKERQNQNKKDKFEKNKHQKDFKDKKNDRKLSDLKDVHNLPSSINEKVVSKANEQQEKLNKAYELNNEKQIQERDKNINKKDEEIIDEVTDEVIKENLEADYKEEDENISYGDDYGELPEEFEGDIEVDENSFEDDGMFASLPVYGADGIKDEEYNEDMSVEEDDTKDASDSINSGNKEIIKEDLKEEIKEVNDSDIIDDNKETDENETEIEETEEVDEDTKNSIEDAFRNFFTF